MQRMCFKLRIDGDTVGYLIFVTTVSQKWPRWQWTVGQQDKLIVSEGLTEHKGMQPARAAWRRQ